MEKLSSRPNPSGLASENAHVDATTIAEERIDQIRNNVKSNIIFKYPEAWVSWKLDEPHETSF